MGKYVFLLLLSGLFFTTRSFSQSKVRGSVKGVLVDSLGGKQPLVNATISVRPLGSDSSEAEYTVSDKKGGFLFRGLTAGQYFVLITYEGYTHIGRNFSISDSSANVDLSTIFMQRADDLLAAAIVQRPPMGIKKDTVEYNAGLFATKPNATAEDLIKKMPGIQVDNSGNVTAQGETVQRVLVDGKRFFSDDPKTATRNLPPDVIDKIQVFDDLSDQSKFTGFDDGNRVKTINIITKKNTRKGIFGKFVGGDGTNEDYDESLNFHVFNGNQQISLLGQANDLNKQNFTAQDIFGGAGGQGRRAGGGGGGGGAAPSSGGGGSNAAGASAAGTSFQSNGVTTVWAGGANYRNSFGPKTDFYGSYFYNVQHIVTKTNDSTISQVGSDSSQTTAGTQYSVGRIENHRIYLNLESRFDSNNSLIFRPNIIFQHSDPSGSSFTNTYTPLGGAINSINSHTSSDNSGFAVTNSDLQFRHRFKKQYRTISLDITGSGNINNGFGYTNSIDNFYQLDSTNVINQHYYDSLRSVTLTPTLSYTEPIAKNMILQLNYSHTYTHSTTINDTYDYVDSLKGYTSFDSLFSNSYKFTQNSDQVSLAWRIQNKKFNLSVGTGIQWTTFNSDNTTKNIPVVGNYTYFTPTVNFMYNFSSTQHFRLNYSGRTGTPSPSQLQPLTTTTDDVNFQVGNQNLKPQFTHSLRMLYASFDPSTQKVLFATVNASTIVNDIQSEVFNRPGGGTTSTYTNLNGTYNFSGYLNYGFPLRRPKSNMNFITNISYSQSQTLLATDTAAYVAKQFTHQYAKNTSLTETVSWTTNIRKNFDMNFSAATNYTSPTHTNIAPPGTPTKDSVVKNGVNSNLNSFSETVSTEFTAYTNNGWLVAATFDYTYTYTGSKTFNASVPILTPSIARQFFKKKNGELRLTVFDVLNQNTNVSKTSGTTVAYTRTNVLQRYAMLTFTYNLNNFPGTQRRGPGMFPGGQFRGGPPGGGGFRGGPLYPIN